MRNEEIGEQGFGLEAGVNLVWRPGKGEVGQDHSDWDRTGILLVLGGPQHTFSMNRGPIFGSGCFSSRWENAAAVGGWSTVVEASDHDGCPVISRLALLLSKDVSFFSCRKFCLSFSDIQY